MTITLQIDDPLASILQTTAASRQLTANELAKQLLADALDNGDDEWEKRNRRRIELIRKSNREGVSAEEAGELQQLQDAADQRLEQVDQQLLDQLNRFRDEVEKLPMKESTS
jgi:hypothetical protein